MDELRAFQSSGSKPIKLRGSYTSGIRVSKGDNLDALNRREEHCHTVLLKGTDYAREAKEKEIQNMLKYESEREKYESISGGLESLEQLSLFGASQLNIGELTEEAMTAVYSKYSFQMKEDTNYLPINYFKQQIIDSILGQSVIIIEGPTGCGKTTQVPQWILDDCYQRRKHCKIIVTQPRRIAAISIARRVAQERGWDVGGLVGYQVGLENKCSNDTRIHYVTTGILLQKLVSAKTMNEYTHIVLDEVHERGQEMDFLLLVVRRLLNTVSPNVKVILMSATFNYEAFASYFLTSTPRGLEPSSCIKVEKKQMFTVKKFYLNDLDKFGAILQRAMPKSKEPVIEPEMYQLVLKLLNAFELIDKQEDNYIDPSEADIPSVLIFLPGINEIQELFNYLTNPEARRQVSEDCVKHNWHVLPLHSTITADEQVRVFQRAPPGKRKIILSTNIAESSITVPDIKYVIDFCLMKVLVADEQTNFTSLQLQWASKTNCEQRAGRAGRVRDGRVYRLVTDSFYETLPQECPPEIRRCPLERLVLLAKMLDMGPPTEILALAMDPPDLSNIQRTILVLKEVGALKKTFEGELNNLDGDITYLGRIMAKLPLDVRVSKLIMLGHIFGCLEEAVIMAAAMTVKNIFSSPFMERLNAYNTKLTWADGSTSDCIAFLKVYSVWRHFHQIKFFSGQGHSELTWAKRSFVQVRALRELDDMVRELNLRLSREGIEPLKGTSPWDRNEKQLLLKVIIAGAFYPHYFVQVGTDGNREREAVKMLGGLDPRTTVYLKDFPMNQPGQVYSSSIKKIVKKLTGDEPRVSFDGNSCKVYLSFEDHSRATGSQKKDNSGNPSIPGKVVLPVYKAVKAKQLKMDIRLALLPVEKANQLATAFEDSKMDINKDKMVPRLPSIEDTHFPMKISQFVNVGRFWVQYDDESTASDLRLIHNTLNKRPLLVHTGNVSPGDILAAPYQDETGTAIYRVRVQKVMPDDMVWVFYIDFGSFGRVNVCSLRTLPSGICQELPPLAMECTLAEVAPSNLLDSHGQWTQHATQFFESIVRKSRLFAKVYSVNHGVIAIELMVNEHTSVNKLLVEKGFAQPCEESYESKLNHDLREMASELEMKKLRGYNQQQMESAFQELREVAPPNAGECVTSVHLKGPFSPLESKVYNLMHAGLEKTVCIEWNSVNSVLLDTEPEAVYERLLVAGVVGTSETGGRMTLRHTTLMPNIPGLPAILALLFCPTSELRRDVHCTRYVKVLCGLGASENGTPLFPEHDLLVNVDVVLTLHDLELINHIRHLMDYMMYCAEGQDQPTMDQFRPKVPATIRKDLLELLSTRRKHCDNESVPYEWYWKTMPEEELLEITEPSMLEQVVIYPLHTPLELRPMDQDQLRALKNENDRLVAEVQSTPLSSSKEFVCKLCGTEPLLLRAMRIHLSSRVHKENAEDFRVFDS